eukprot:1162020-Pelagomonas_calceolata.AAC.16
MRPMGGLCEGRCASDDLCGSHSSIFHASALDLQAGRGRTQRHVKGAAQHNGPAVETMRAQFGSLCSTRNYPASYLILPETWDFDISLPPTGCVSPRRFHTSFKKNSYFRTISGPGMVQGALRPAKQP